MTETNTALEKVQPLPEQLMPRLDAFLVRTVERLPEAQKSVEVAKAFVVDSEDQFQLADQVMNDLKNAGKDLNEERLAITRPIDDFKAQFTDAAKPVIESYHEAAREYQSRMTAYRSEQRQKAEAARREAERLLREEREKKEAEARRLEEKAAKLKTAAAQQKAMEQADALREEAALVPETLVLSTPEPQTVASNVATIWKAVVSDKAKFLEWLITKPEWLSCVSFQTGEMNRLARQMRDAVAVPGVKISPTDSYRSKGR